MVSSSSRKVEICSNVVDPKQIVHSDPDILGGTAVFVGTVVPGVGVGCRFHGGCAFAAETVSGACVIHGTTPIHRTRKHVNMCDEIAYETICFMHCPQDETPETDRFADCPQGETCDLMTVVNKLI